MKDDYKELLGEEIWYVMSRGTTRRAFMAGIDYKGGIAVLDKDDPTDELVCLNKGDTYSYASYDDLFDFLVLSIGMGIIFVKDNKGLFPVPALQEMYGSRSGCAFK